MELFFWLLLLLVYLSQDLTEAHLQFCLSCCPMLKPGAAVTAVLSRWEQLRMSVDNPSPDI